MQFNRLKKLQLAVAMSACLPAVGKTSDIEEVLVLGQSPLANHGNYQPVTSFGEDQLVQMTAISLGEMLDGQPGLYMRSFGGAPARPIIRGFDGERLLVLENGERMGDIQSTAPDHAVTLDPLGMNEIEVIRGPASLLYGASALGGVINVFSNDFMRAWDPGLSGGLTAVGSSIDRGVATGGVLTYGTERNAVTGRFTVRSNSNARTPNETIPNTHSDSHTFSLGWAHRTDRFSGGVSLRYYQSEFGIPEFASVTDPDNPDRFIELEPDMEIRIDRLNMQARGNWALNGFFEELQIRTSLSRSLQEEGEPNVPPDLLELEIDTSTISSTALLRHGDWGMFHRGFFGLNVHYRHQEVDGIEAYHPGEDLINVGVFTMQEAELTPRLNMLTGLRIEQEWLDGTSNRYFPQAELPSDTTTNIAASLGFDYALTEFWGLGLQFARAHRNATILERYADGWHAGATRIELGDSSLESEVGYGIDFLTRYSDNSLDVELAVYYNRIDDFIALRTLDPGCGDIEFRVQPDREFPACVQFFGANAEQFGVELNADWFLTDNLRVQLVSDIMRGNRRDVDEPLPFMPPMRFTTGLVHDDGTWRFGGSVRYVHQQTRVPENELPTSSFTTLRLEGGYRMGGHQLSVRLDNALDSSYSDHLSVVRRYRDPVLGPDAPTRFEMPGRSFTVSYRYSF